jgi:hypothetical protein
MSGLKIAAAIGEAARRLADRIGPLAVELLPAGRREGPEWRVGNLQDDAGDSLGVHLVGEKRGIWCDFATGEKGDAFDLVRAVKRFGAVEALEWSRNWFGEPRGVQGNTAPAGAAARPRPSWVGSEVWRRAWRDSVPIGGTLVQTYFAARRLEFRDPAGRILRFADRRCRKNPADEFEHHPALLAQLSDVRTGAPCGIINVYLQPDGRDRLRDKKGKTTTGRARNAAVMLSAFDEPTMGLVLCEGVETGIAVHQSGLRPVWACGPAGILGNLPVLGGIEALSIAADRDGPGMQAAGTVTRRWHLAGREASIVAPPTGDWADR